MRWADLISLPAWLGTSDHSKPDHSTIPLAFVSASMPFVHFSLTGASETAAKLAPILGVALVLLRGAAIIRNEIFAAPAPEPSKPKPKRKPKRKPANGKKGASVRKPRR